ncbi:MULTISPECIES: MFS transporter [Streptomyces]|uniref:MFS transporter n=1 Tax=Streptomyces violaceoruber TaxID=1935 RepID=A0ACD4WH97_STRVN|nr:MULTISPECIES: MFS transporter [unclassified Streptomyces]REH24587.1 MFS-type transporter involved in bile tolerance (Atg22 family) [Streptomyces sp. 2221.1]WOY97067.1 MFS transporter [Streptomyces violaceoruber]SDT78730.1 MFS-type transporter involved in bile tolerance, Atg22 family [Streptomyces sp. 2114.2]
MLSATRRGRETPGKERLGPPFRLFQSAVVSSDLADGIYKIAVPLLALGISRSAVAVGAVGLAVRLPWLIATLPAGVLADRYPPRSVMRWASAVRLPLVAAMCALAATDRLPLWALVVTAFLIGCAGIFVDVAAQSQLPRLVPVGQLPKANASLQSTQMFLAQLIGPALGGYVVALGSGGGLAVVVALYVVTVWALGLLPAAVEQAAAGHARPATEPARAGAGRRSSFGSLVAELGEGLRYFRGRGDLARLATAAAVNNLSYSMCLTMLPLWAVRPGRLGLSETGYGLLLTFLAVGSILAGLVTGRILDAVGDGPVMRFGAPLLGLCFLALAVPAVPVIALGLFVYGLVSMVWNVTVTSYRQATIPLPLFGRVNAAYRWLTWGVIPFGSLFGGTLAATAGTTWVFLTAGALPLVAAALLPPPRPRTVPEAPVSDAPVSEAPVPDAPVQETPVPGASVPDAPVQEPPAPEARAGEAPVPDVPALEGAVADASAAGTPVPDLPAHKPPVLEARDHRDPPVLDVPAHKPPVSGVPVLDVPAHKPPVSDVPALEAPAAEAPALEVPYPDTPARTGAGVDGPAGTAADGPAEAAAGQPDHAPGAARTGRPHPDRRKPALTGVPDAAAAARPADPTSSGVDATRAARD